jgi:hypothetical protein
MTHHIDDDVIKLAISNGLDCSGVACLLKPEEQNEMTILEHVYLR